MKDNLNNLEKTFKKIVEEAEFEPNMDGLWDRVEEQLEDEPRRGPFFFWWGLGVGGIVVISLIISYLVLGANPIFEETQEIDPLDVSPIINGVVDNEILQVESDAKPSDLGRESNDQIIDVVYNDSKKVKVFNKTSEEIVGVSPRTDRSTKINDRLIKAFDKNITSDITVNKIRLANNNSIIQKKLETGNIEKQVTSNTGIENNSVYNDKQPDKKSILLSEIGLLPLYETEIEGEQRSIVVDQEISHVLDHNGIYFFRIRGGALMGSTKVSDVDPSLDFDISAFGREKDKISYDFGIDVGRYLGDWRLYGGASIKELVTQYRYNEKEFSTTTEDGVTIIYIDDMGHSSFFTGDMTVSNVTNYDVQWNRRHQMIDLHVGVGRKLFTYGSFSVGLDGMLGYNVYSSHKGYQFREGSDILEKLNQGIEHNYQKNMGMSAAIMGEVTFNIRKVDISLVPVWRYQFNPLTKTENNYQIKNSQLGLQLGITYKPHWK